MEMLGAIAENSGFAVYSGYFGYDLGQGEGEQNGWRGVGAIFSTGQ